MVPSLAIDKQNCNDNYLINRPNSIAINEYNFEFEFFLDSRLNMQISNQTFGFHLVNTILHGIAAVLVAYLTRNELKFDLEYTFLASLLFATHPIHCEAVSQL